MSIFFFQLSSFHLNFNKCCIYIILDFLGFMISLGKIWDEIIFYTLTLHFQRNRCLKCTLVFIHGNLSSTLYFHDILWSPSTFYHSHPSTPQWKFPGAATDLQLCYILNGVILILATFTTHTHICVCGCIVFNKVVRKIYITVFDIRILHTGCKSWKLIENWIS